MIPRLTGKRARQFPSRCWSIATRTATGSELEDDFNLLVQSNPNLFVHLPSKRHDRLSDRALDPKTPVTTCDGNLDSSPFAACVLDRRSDPGFKPQHRTAVPTDGMHDECAEKEMLWGLAQEVFQHLANLVRIGD
jgi:hypothetical protein